MLNFYPIKGLKKGKKEAQIRTFFSKNDYITQDLTTEKVKWLTAAFDRMDCISLYKYHWDRETGNRYTPNMFFWTDSDIDRMRKFFKESMTKAGNKMTAKKQVFPIYDWTDNDVWLFLLRNHVDIPEIYLFLWQSGSSKRQMRVSQFFSVDTARSLVKMNEYYPDLMERIIRREPNAYLAALYWDSEMFGRSSRKRKEAEKGQEQKDYRQELIYLFNHMDVFFDTPHKRHVAERYRNFFMSVSAIATDADYKHIYEGLISGDPKMRAFRALYQRIYGRYISDAKKGERHG